MITYFLLDTSIIIDLFEYFEKPRSIQSILSMARNLKRSMNKKGAKGKEYLRWINDEYRPTLVYDFLRNNCRANNCVITDITSRLELPVIAIRWVLHKATVSPMPLFLDIIHNFVDFEVIGKLRSNGFNLIEYSAGKDDYEIAREITKILEECFKQPIRRFAIDVAILAVALNKNYHFITTDVDFVNMLERCRFADRIVCPRFDTDKASFGVCDIELKLANKTGIIHVIDIKYYLSKLRNNSV